MIYECDLNDLVISEKKVVKRRKFTKNVDPSEVLIGIDLSNQTVLITGTTHGIGFETAKHLATAGAHVVMANRDIRASAKIRECIYRTTNYRKVDFIELDLASLKSVEDGANEFLKKGWPLNILILNAGVVGPAKKTTVDGYETTFGVNHLGHFYLTHLLKHKLKEAHPARVIVVSSNMHKFSMIKFKDPIEKKMKMLVPKATTKAKPLLLYSRSKLCNILFAFKLHRELNEKGVNVYAVHPGMITNTNLFTHYNKIHKTVFGHMIRPFSKSVTKGASTTVFCAAHPSQCIVSGRYYEDCHDDHRMLDETLANNETLQDALWKKSMELIENYEKSTVQQ